jgi:hypothetical protein
MAKFGKIRNISGKTSTHREENIFPKYLLYYVDEIARKYPREKKRYSSFSDSVVFSTCHLRKKKKIGKCLHSGSCLRTSKANLKKGELKNFKSLASHVPTKVFSIIPLLGKSFLVKTVPLTNVLKLCSVYIIRAS